MRLADFKIINSVNLQASQDNAIHEKNQKTGDTMDSYIDETVGLCEAINCDEAICEKICELICDGFCEQVCDEWCDGVCDVICEQVCDVACDSNCDILTYSYGGI